jgi:hypothetical protein
MLSFDKEIKNLAYDGFGRMNVIFKIVPFLYKKVD